MSTLVSQGDFESEVLNSTGVVLVDFYTKGCGPCNAMTPVLDQIAHERPDVKVVKIDAGTNVELADAFRISVVPTFILFVNGQIKGQLTSMRSQTDLLRWIDSNR